MKKEIDKTDSCLSVILMNDFQAKGRGSKVCKMVEKKKKVLKYCFHDLNSFIISRKQFIADEKPIQ